MDLQNEQVGQDMLRDSILRQVCRGRAWRALSKAKREWGQELITIPFRFENRHPHIDTSLVTHVGVKRRPGPYGHLQLELLVQHQPGQALDNRAGN